MAFDTSTNPYLSGFSTPRMEWPQIHDAMESAAIGPESNLGVPHILSFMSILGTAWRTYWHGGYDQALKHSRENSDAMRNDPFLMRIVNERKYAVMGKDPRVEVDNARDPWQKAVRDGVLKVYKCIPNLTDLRWSLLEALFVGRAGEQTGWGWKSMDLPALPRQGVVPGKGDTQRMRAMSVHNHVPWHGDKVGYNFDGVPYVLVSALAATQIAKGGGAGDLFARSGGSERSPRWRPMPDYSERNPEWYPPLNAESADIGYSTVGQRALFLKSPSWRQRFVLHAHEKLDAQFWNAEQADSIHGIGLRSVIYWYWWLRQEFLSNVTDWCARIGLGVRVWYFEAGNQESYQQVLKASREQSNRTNILVPVFSSERGGKLGGVEFVDTSGTGADLLLKIVEHLEKHIELYVIGQSMSTGNDLAGSLGGTGRAKFAEGTKFAITRFDAAKLGESETEDLLKVIVRWTYGKEFEDMPIRLVYPTDEPDPDDWMEGAKTFVDMGGSIVADEARERLNLRTPHEGEETLGGQVATIPEQQIPGAVAPTNGQPSNGQQQPLAMERYAHPLPTVGGRIVPPGSGQKAEGFVEVGGEHHPHKPSGVTPQTPTKPEAPAALSEPPKGIPAAPVQSPAKALLAESPKGLPAVRPPSAAPPAAASPSVPPAAASPSVPPAASTPPRHPLGGEAGLRLKSFLSYSPHGDGLSQRLDRVYSGMKATGLTPEEYKQFLMTAWKDRAIELKVLNEVGDLTPEQRAAIPAQGENVYGYAIMRNPAKFDALLRQVNTVSTETRAPEPTKEPEAAEAAEAPEPEAPAKAPPAKAPPRAKREILSSPPAGLSHAEMYYPMAKKMAREYVERVGGARGLSRSDADDLAQEAMMALVEAEPKFDPERGVPFAGFARTVIANAMESHGRKAGAQKRGGGKVGSLEPEVSGQIPERPQSDEPTVQDLYDAIERMDDPAQVVLLKMRLAGKSLGEMAREQGTSKTAMHGKFKQAVEAARRAVAPERHERLNQLTRYAELDGELAADDGPVRYGDYPVLPEVWDTILRESAQFGPRAPEFIRAVMEAMRPGSSQWEAIVRGRQAFLAQGSARYERDAAEAVSRALLKRPIIEQERQSGVAASRAVQAVIEKRRAAAVERAEVERMQRVQEEADRRLAVIIEAIRNQPVQAPPVVYTQAPDLERFAKAIPQPAPIDLEALLAGFRDIVASAIKAAIKEAKPEAIDYEKLAESFAKATKESKRVVLKKTKEGYEAEVE